MESVAVERPPGRWVGRLSWVAVAVFVLVLLVPVGVVIAWFSWHPTEHYAWTVTSESADGRTLTLEVGGFFGTPTAQVHENATSVRIDVTSPVGPGFLAHCEGQEQRTLVVTLRAPLGTRRLTGSRQSC